MGEIWRKNKILVVVLLIVVFLLPNAISQSSNYSSYIICMGVGIDYNENEYEFSTQIIIPEQVSSFKQKLQVYSSVGKNLKECEDNLNMHLGKKIGLAHCSYVVLNENVLNGKIVSCLDFLIRNYNINYNCAVIATDKKSKDILTLSAELNNNQGLDVSHILDYNNDNIFSLNPNIENVYNSLLGGSPNYALGIFTTDTKAEKGVSVAGEVGSGSSGTGENGGEGQGGEQNKNENVLVNGGDVVLMNKSDAVAKINVKEAYGVRYLNTDNKIFNLEVNNFSDDVFKNANLQLYSNKKYQYNRYYFENDVPVVELNICQYLTVAGVEQESYIKNYYGVDKTNFSNELKYACEKEIKNKIEQGVSLLKELNCDVTNLYSNFEKYEYNKFKKYLAKLEDEKKYMQNIIFKINVFVEHYKE